MDTGRISVRYAKAVYDLALERGEETRIYNEMKTLANSFATFHGLKKALENPTLPSQDKIKVLKTAAGIDVSEIYMSLLKLLIANKRESYAYSIALMYAEYYRRKKGIVIVQLTTQEEASEQMKTSLMETITKFEHKQVDFETKVDDTLIGGFILRLDDHQLDASTKTQLARLKKQLME